MPQTAPRICIAEFHGLHFVPGMESITIRYSDNESLAAVRDSISAYPPERALIQVFDGVSDSGTLQQILHGLSEYFPGYPVIGANSNSGILNGQCLDGAVVLCFSLFDRTKVKTVLIEQNQDMEGAGRAVAEGLSSTDTKAVITFGCGLQEQVFLDNGVYLKTLSEALGGIPISGGLAGGEYAGSLISYVFTNKGLTSSGFAAAALSGSELRVFCDYDFGMVPVGKAMTITKAEGKRVYTINDTSVSDLYQKHLGLDLNQISIALMNKFPLMRNKSGAVFSDIVSNVYDDGSADFIQQLNLGEQVRFGICDARVQEDGVHRVNRSLRAFRPDSVFLYACASRKVVFGETVDVDMALFEEMPPSCGLYTFGEFFSADTREALFFHQAMTVLALAEGSAAAHPAAHLPPSDLSVRIGDSDKYVQLKALINLVTCTTKELEAANRSLSELAHTDGLTGLGNRRKFDDRLDWTIRTHARSSTPFTLILLDVDYFKLFNDAYGHVDGDDCLRSLGHAIREVLKRAGDEAFRYGGEEFACILSSTDADDGATVAERIRRQVESLGIPHRHSAEYGCVTVSLGALAVRADRFTNSNGIIDQCDSLLYEAKKTGRNRVVVCEIGNADQGQQS